MGLRINQNITALNAHRNLVATDSALSKSLERLSSGLRINRAADDAAGLAISEKMRGQVNGLAQASRNAQDGISLIQTAEGALNEVHSILQRMRQLAVQAANDTLTLNDRVEIQREIDQLKAEINRIANTTEFNTKKLLDGTASVLASTDKATTQVIAKGPVGTFGNFELKIDATPGQSQILKTDIFKAPGLEITDLTIDTVNSGIQNITRNTTAGYTMPVGSYSVATSIAAAGVSTGIYNLRLDTTNSGLENVTVSSGNFVNGTYTIATSVSVAAAGATANYATFGTVSITTVTINTNVANSGYLAMRVASVNTTDGEITFDITAYFVDQTGALSTATYTGVTVSESSNVATDINTAISPSGFSFSNFTIGDADDFAANSVIFFRITGAAQNGDDRITITGPNGDAITYTLDAGTLAADPSLYVVSFDATSGTVTSGVLNFQFGTPMTDSTAGSFIYGAYNPASYSTSVYSQNNAALVSNAATSLDAARTNSSGYLLLEVTNISGSQVTFNVNTYYVDSLGVASSTAGNVVLTADGNTNVAASVNAVISNAGFAFNSFTLENVNQFKKGDKILFRIGATNTLGDDLLTISKTSDVGSGQNITYAFGNNVLDNTTQPVWTAYLDTTNGRTYVGQLNFQFGTPAADPTAASFSVTRTGALAPADITATLAEVDRFTDANGNFLVQYPQTITIYQGNGRSTTVTFFATDTLEDVQNKLNQAIAEGLGQKQYVGDNDNRFVQYVLNPVANTPEAVAGTFVIRTAVPGEEGKLYFSGDQAFINALSLNVIQEAEDSQFTVTIANAHNGEKIGETVISGNRLVGALDPNVDILFDAMSDIRVSFNATERSWEFTADPQDTKTYVHLANSSLIFHIGANAKQDMNASIGRIDTTGLNIDSILLIDNATANDAIVRLDRAITQVSDQRAILGALQNRLEHTIANLGVARENIAAAESRIRDVDMAEEMMAFTRAQILMQAGVAMLAQANTIPQMVLQLLR